MEELLKNEIVISITGKFSYQTFPLLDKTINVLEEDLEQIGVTKCFDVENNTIIDYDNSLIIEREMKINRINELKGLLNESDYKLFKYIEGVLDASEYAPIKHQRQLYRDEINRLEDEIAR